MKKIFLLALTALMMAGCVNEKINGIPLEEGSTMTYETKDYIIRYEVTGFNNFGQAIWAFKEIRNKRDSIMELKKEN